MGCLNSSSHSLGPVDLDTVEKVEAKITDQEKARLERFSNRPPLDEILNLHDFEVGGYLIVHILFWFWKAIAKQVMPEKAWAYYSSAADDEITIRENHAAYHRYVPQIIIEIGSSLINFPEYGSAHKYWLMWRKSIGQQRS